MTQQRDGRRWTPALALVAAVLVITAGFAGVAAAEQPEPPHRFFGTVENADGQAVQGVTVEAVHDGEVVATDTTGEDGYFDVRVSSDDVEDGETVTVRTSDDSESFAFESGGSTEVPLTVQTDGGDGADGDDGTDGGDGADGDDGTDGGDGADGDDGTDDGDGAGGGGAGGGGAGGADQTTAQPTTAQPTTAQPTTAQPTTAQPTTAQPTTDQQTTQPPTTDGATTAQQGTDEPDRTTTSAGTPIGTDDDESGGSIPGFGAGIAVVALAAAALLASRNA